jgi:FlaA1/EpsC-like NDP-sugar epimerase
LNSGQYILADILDATKMRSVFERIQPDIVLHAAARKHLPLLERSPEAAVMTNVLGTHIIAETSAAVGAAHFINISTDKAAHPTSVLGLTKRLAEMTAANVANAVTKVASVRFGNVLGSRGSFLETLAYQMSHGLPVTITDRDMTRYFMTIPEAAGLVIEATALTDVGKIYVLDMGEPIQITDLVERYVQLTHSEAPEIRFTGIRPGEKLHEELSDLSETLQTTSHDRIFAVDMPANRISSLELQRICDTARSCPPAARLKADLENLVYKPRDAEKQVGGGGVVAYRLASDPVSLLAGTSMARSAEHRSSERRADADRRDRRLNGDRRMRVSVAPGLALRS